MVTRARWILLLTAGGLLGAQGCGDDVAPRPEDQVPPGTVTNLLARAEADSVVVLTWSAPGDDGRIGRASRYELRYSLADPDLPDWWEALSSEVPSPPAPGPPGAPEEHRVRGLVAEASYAFRLRTFDETGNASPLSNVARVTLEPPRPPAVEDLAAATVTSSWIDLSWSAPRGGVSAAVAYELRISLSPIDEESWDDAEAIPGLPEPGPPGAPERFRLLEREASRTYYIALRTRSSGGVLSLLGPALAVDTPSIRLLRGSAMQEFPDLVTALAAAADGEVIELDAGRFTGPGNRDLLVEDKDVTLRGADPRVGESRLDLEGQGRGLVFRGAPESGSVVQWITFAGGLAAEGSLFGGAVSCFSAGPAFVGCRFLANRAESTGGAVALTNGSSARFEECRFEENTSGTAGGAAWIEGQSAPRFARCTFRENRAATRGGAVAIRDGSPEFDECQFTGNEADRDGGALAYERAGGQVRHTVFRANVAGRTDVAGGGAVFCFEGSLPLFTGCRFEENIASRWGGALYAWKESSPRFELSLFVANRAEEGGAGLAFNQARPEFDRCTLVANTAQFGGGLRAIGSASGFVLSRSILAFQENGDSVYCQDGATFTLTCTLVYGNEPRDWVPCIEGQRGQAGNLDVDPLFCFPGDRDYRLSPESPAADALGCGTLGALGVGCAP